MKYLILIILSTSLVNCTSEKCVSHRGSYFVPSKGTVKRDYGRFCAPIEVRGMQEGNPILSYNEFESRVVMISGDGSEVWSYDFPMGPSKGNFFNQTASEVSFTYRSNIIRVNKWTGEVLSVRTIPDAYGLRAQVIDSGTLGIVTAMEARIISTTGERLFTSAHSLKYPRGVDVMGDLLIIGDTFNHRVIGIDPNTDALAFELSDYYPSMALVLNAQEMLIVAEHSNRIYKYNIDTDERTWIYGCRAHSAYEDLSQWKQLTTLAKELTHPKGMGICAIEYNEGQETLYSVGGVEVNKDGTLLIADTDNHRVIHVKQDGTLIREFRNLNNPVRAMEVW